MKRLLALMLVLGGVLVMVTGCTVFADKQSDEAQVKQDMKPFFDFLAEENKDFSKVKSYVSSVLVLGDSKKKFRVTYTNNRTFYQILDSNGDIIQETSVSIVNNQLVYEDTSIEPFPNDWFFVTIPTSVIDQAEVTDVMASHPETYMRDMTLKVTDNPSFLQKLREQQGSSTDGAVNVYFQSTSQKKFDVNVTLYSPQEGSALPKSFTYYNFVTFE